MLNCVTKRSKTRSERSIQGPNSLEVASRDLDIHPNTVNASDDAIKGDHIPTASSKTFRPGSNSSTIFTKAIRSIGAGYLRLRENMQNLAWCIKAYVNLRVTQFR